MLRSNIIKNLSTKRFYSEVLNSSKLQITDLSNGIIVATTNNLSNPADPPTIGLTFGSGSSSETPYNNGISNITSKIFQNNSNLAQASQNGFKLNSIVEREYQNYSVTLNNKDTLGALKFLQNSFGENNKSLSEANVAEAKSKVLNQLEQFEAVDQNSRIIEHLHSTAFQNTPLSLPKRGTVESVENVETSDVQAFANKNFTNSNVVIVGSGFNDVVAHKEFVKQVDSIISLNNSELIPKDQLKPVAKSTFLGSEVRLRDDTLPKAWITIAVESEPLTSPDYLTAKLASEIFGSYNAFEPRSRLQGVKLLDNLQEYQLCETFNHFNYSYNNTGLWGFSTVTTNFSQIDDLLHFTLKQWNRLTISITEQELARGKALLKLKLGLPVSNSINNSIIGSNILSQVSPIDQPNDSTNLLETYKKIDSITIADMKNWASKRLWDQDIAIAGAGQIEGLLDYMRMRNDMSMMRW
ncbi:hypothetical protein TBLA_0F02710 [Henningerozyma blattae CBS 6284]|uniref:Peptidase M16 C-terminal domain-containing protein n=1 Tax=Henningerozyma blattae (strain ATCC 34711 / CBS 6284 / DSM 70876 / NBRC 10599 / NRRL Y-10934 / UCD 77-7) TaxID=1071380 RepID=I2H608_HENB6|nr:hypothetical protein TBLA_0F02710 [Tetrapisispora blattae CBS 6284]CCH61810.1 hypothetical protein TBLA_0F02710 [Tetrapisispora blattae CBS 6284]